MSLHRKVDDIFSRVYYKIYCFGKDISQKKELSGCKSGKISKSQKREAEKYYIPYGKIDTCYHDFYYAVTGKFDPRYIPNNLFYKYIDTFYGNKKKTSGLENKCLYEQLFPNMKHPKKYAYRMNGFWYDSENNFRGRLSEN